MWIASPAIFLHLRGFIRKKSINVKVALVPQWQLIITLCRPVPYILRNPVQYYCHTLLRFLWPLPHRWRGLGQTSKWPQGWVSCLPGAQPEGKVRKLWWMHGSSLGTIPHCPTFCHCIKPPAVMLSWQILFCFSSRLHHCSIICRTSPGSRSFFQDISHPSSSLYHLLPLHVIHLSCLGSEQPHGLHVLSHAPKNIVPLLITP